MSWGDALANAYAAATDRAKAAAIAVANSTEEAYDRGREMAVAGYDHARDAAVQGYQTLRDKAEDAVDAAKQSLIERRYQQTLGAEAAAQRAFDKARAKLGPNKAGAPVQRCPLPSPKCAKLAEARTKAIMSEDTYNPPGVVDDRLAATGYRYLDPSNPADREELGKKLGLNDPELTLSPAEFDFRARIYARALPDGRTDYVIGFRGTQTGADWLENFKQGTGQSGVSGEDAPSPSSYRRAMQLANIVAKRAKEDGDMVSFTGHSLGGGMASAASAITRDPAMTFNAAGLNAHTLGGFLPEPPVPVDAYFTPTDPLSALQDNRTSLLTGLVNGASKVPHVGGVLAVGLGAWLGKNELAGTPVMPQAYGTRHVLPPVGKAPDLSVEGLKDAHGMARVIKGIDAQRKDLGCS